MVKHKSHNLISRCHLSEEAGVSCFWEASGWTGLSKESIYLYPLNASFSMDPCGEIWSLLASSQPTDSLTMFLSMTHKVFSTRLGTMSVDTG